MLSDEEIGDIAAKYTHKFHNEDRVAFSVIRDAIREAIAEQAATHARELSAYEATVENLEQRIRELEAQRVPEDWQLVPKEPTDEMIDHGCDEADAYRVDIVRAYQAMLAVSPEVGGND